MEASHPPATTTTMAASTAAAATAPRPFLSLASLPEPVDDHSPHRLALVSGAGSQGVGGSNSNNINTNSGDRYLPLYANQLRLALACRRLGCAALQDPISNDLLPADCTRHTPSPAARAPPPCQQRQQRWAVGRMNSAYTNDSCDDNASTTAAAFVAGRDSAPPQPTPSAGTHTRPPSADASLNAMFGLEPPAAALRHTNSGGTTNAANGSFDKRRARGGAATPSAATTTAAVTLPPDYIGEWCAALAVEASASSSASSTRSDSPGRRRHGSAGDTPQWQRSPQEHQLEDGSNDEGPDGDDGGPSSAQASARPKELLRGRGHARGAGRAAPALSSSSASSISSECTLPASGDATGMGCTPPPPPPAISGAPLALRGTTPAPGDAVSAASPPPPPLQRRCLMLSELTAAELPPAGHASPYALLLAAERAALARGVACFESPITREAIPTAAARALLGPAQPPAAASRTVRTGAATTDGTSTTAPHGNALRVVSNNIRKRDNNNSVSTRSSSTSSRSSGADTYSPVDVSYHKYTYLDFSAL